MLDKRKVCNDSAYVYIVSGVRGELQSLSDLYSPFLKALEARLFKLAAITTVNGCPLLKSGHDECHGRTKAFFYGVDTLYIRPEKLSCWRQANIAWGETNIFPFSDFLISDFSV